MNKIIKAKYKCYTDRACFEKIQIFRRIQKVFGINKRRNKNGVFGTSVMGSWDQIKKRKAVNLRTYISIIRKWAESIKKIHWNEFKKRIH